MASGVRLNSIPISSWLILSMVLAHTLFFRPCLCLFSSLTDTDFGSFPFISSHRHVTHRYFLRAHEQPVDSICLSNKLKESPASFGSADTLLVGLQAAMDDGNTLCADSTVYLAWSGSNDFMALKEPYSYAAKRGWEVSVWKEHDKTDTVSLFITNELTSAVSVKTSETSYTVDGKSNAFGQLVAPSTEFNIVFSSLPMVHSFFANTWANWTANQNKHFAAVLADPIAKDGTETLVSYLFYKPISKEKIHFYIYEASFQDSDVEEHGRQLTSGPYDYDYSTPDTPSSPPPPPPSPTSTSNSPPPPTSPPLTTPTSSPPSSPPPLTPTSPPTPPSSPTPTTTDNSTNNSSSTQAPVPLPSPLNSNDSSPLSPFPTTIAPSPGYYDPNSTLSTTASGVCPRGYCFRNKRPSIFCKRGKRYWPACLYICICR